MSRLTQLIATLGPIGYLPVAPATWASAAVTLAGWFLPVPPLFIALAALALGTVLAVWACDQAERNLGHDAHPIVLDELIGQSIALLGAPHTWGAFLTAFVLFRLFDIWKPLGARRVEGLRGGLGVVADDFVAGLLSCVVLHLGLWVWRSFGPLG